jgi:hypothetical protein
MNVQETTELRELTVTELDEVTGGGLLSDIVRVALFGAGGGYVHYATEPAWHSWNCCAH